MFCRTIAIVVGMFGALSSAQGQTTWYVDDDNCPGPGIGTQADPFWNIQAAIDTASGGDIVRVAWGIYNDTVGLKDNVSLFGGHDPATWLLSNAGTSVIDGTGIPTDPSNPGISIPMTNVTLDGFEITGWSWGLSRVVFPACSNITISNNDFHNNVMAFFIFGLIDTLVEHNMFHDNNESLVSNQPRDLSVINNVFYDNPGGQYNAGGFYYFHEVGTVEVLNNTFVNCAIAVAGQQGLSIIKNNLIVANGVGISNLLVNNGQVDIAFNCVWNNITDYDIVTAGPTDISEDPNFVDEHNDNYRLQVPSPCIDAGDNTAVPPSLTTDLDGLPRFIDDPATPDTGNGTPPIVDMGAYEFQQRTASELLQDLITAVIGLNLQHGITTSLDAKLNAVLQALLDLNQNNNAATCNALGAFVNAVQAQSGHQIPQTDADALIAAAQEIIALLNCP